MRGSILSSNLKKALSILVSMLEPKPSFPILSNVLLEARESRLYLSAVNFSDGLGLRLWIGCNVEIEGATTLPLKLLKEWADKMPDWRIDFNLDRVYETLELRCSTTEFKAKGITAMEFPPVGVKPEMIVHSVPVQAKLLRLALEQTEWSIAKDTRRPALTKLCVSLNDKAFSLAAADGYTLAVSEILMNAQQDKSEPVVTGLTPKAITLLKKLIDKKDIGDLCFHVMEGRNASEVGFGIQYENWELWGIYEIGFHPARHVIGKEDGGNIVPRHIETSVRVYRDDLLKAVDRAELMAHDSAYSITIEAPHNRWGAGGEIVTLSVRGRSQERGEIVSQLDAVAGANSMCLNMAINSKYLRNAAEMFADKEIYIENDGPIEVTKPNGIETEWQTKCPALIRPATDVEGMKAYCVVMPMAR